MDYYTHGLRNIQWHDTASLVVILSDPLWQLPVVLCQDCGLGWYAILSTMNPCSAIVGMTSTTATFTTMYIWRSRGSDKLAATMGLKSKSSESYSSLRPQQTAPQTRPRPYPRPRPRPAQRSRRTSVLAWGTQRRGTHPNPVPSARGTQQRSTGSSQSTEDTAMRRFINERSFLAKGKRKSNGRSWKSTQWH